MVTKTELINKLYGTDHRQVIQAVEELRERGWLIDGTLRGIGLCRAQLQGADLVQADLRNVDFHQADLEAANLSLAKLQSAKLTRTNLRSANLYRADLTNAELYKADLREAFNLTDDQLRRAKRLWGAVMPHGESYDGRFRLAADLAQARWAKLDLDDPKAMADFYGVSVEAYLRGQEAMLEKATPPA